MVTVTHFRTEFIRQMQATILRRVTMTQFMFVVLSLAIGLGLFQVSWWLAPLFIVVGYAAGYVHQGEILIKRLLASFIVWARSLVGRPRVINIQSMWETARLEAEQGGFRQHHETFGQRRRER